MKKLSLLLFATALIMSSCNNHNQFKVTLNLTDADNQTAYLFKAVDNEEILIDSAVINNNKAVMNVDFDDPQTLYYIKFEKNERCNRFPFFTENQNTTINGNSVEDMQLWRVDGCPAMDILNTYSDGMISFGERIEALLIESNEYALAEDEENAKEAFHKAEAVMEEYHAYELEYISNLPDTYVAHYILYLGKDDFEYDEVKKIAEGFKTESVFNKSIQEYLETYGRIQPGAPAMDFTLQTADGKDVNLMQTIKANKYTLVDFWASWCMPCREENPFVKMAYQKFHSKGLAIIGVSVDRNEASWLQAVKDDDLPWTHVRDINGSAANEYLVKYIPSNFLFNQDGVIVATNLRGEELEAKLAELLK